VEDLRHFPVCASRGEDFAKAILGCPAIPESAGLEQREFVSSNKRHANANARRAPKYKMRILLFQQLEFLEIAKMRKGS
jgi:hypothetical protein